MKRLGRWVLLAAVFALPSTLLIVVGVRAAFAGEPPTTTTVEAEPEPPTTTTVEAEPEPPTTTTVEAEPEPEPVDGDPLAGPVPDDGLPVFLGLASFGFGALTASAVWR